MTEQFKRKLNEIVRNSTMCNQYFGGDKCFEAGAKFAYPLGAYDGYMEAVRLIKAECPYLQNGGLIAAWLENKIKGSKEVMDAWEVKQLSDFPACTIPSTKGLRRLAMRKTVNLKNKKK